MNSYIVVVMAMIQAIAAPSVTAEDSYVGLQDNNYSMLSNQLQESGYSDVCVAAALDACTAQHHLGTIQQPHNNHTSLLQEVRQVVEQVSDAVNKLESEPRHCKDLLDSGDSGSGLRQIYPYKGSPRVTVFCDHTVAGGGWTVFQRRTNDTIRTSFSRTWVEYKMGFGDLMGEFWLGLDLIHRLTDTTPQQLRVDLEDYEEEHRWAEYDFFHVESKNYRLTLGEYNGTAGDSLSYHSGHEFSTYDKDNDSSGINCAERRKGGFWFKDCSEVNLNGYQYEGNYHSKTSYTYDGITWLGFRGNHYSLRRTTMMIRPVF